MLWRSAPVALDFIIGLIQGLAAIVDLSEIDFAELKNQLKPIQERRIVINNSQTGNSLDNYWQNADAISDSPLPKNRLPGFPETPVEQHIIQGLGSCLFKMEQNCPTGSHKDRAAIFQVSMARQAGAPGVIIPSSGNAAIAVASAGAKVEIPVFAFVSPNTHPGKLTAAAQYKPRLIICDNPINRARNAARRFGMPNLRPSIDDNAVKGFMTLGYALGKLYLDKPFSSIFIFTTSGATLVGIARALKDLALKSQIDTVPELHAVQAGKATAIASEFDSSPSPIPKNGQGAGFGGVASSQLNPELLAHIRSTGGAGWLTSEPDAENMYNLLIKENIHTSPEGCCALAAAIRWRRAGGVGTPLVILTGKHYPITQSEPDFGEALVCKARTYGEIERFMRK